MATTLSNGFVRPDNNDPGSVWMPAIANDITQLNSHNHDGINSEPIDSTAILKLTTTILSAAWVSGGGGNYSQVVTVPAQISEINNFFIKIYNTATGDIIYPTIERVTAATYRLRVNDNTLNLTAVYV